MVQRKRTQNNWTEIIILSHCKANHKNNMIELLQDQYIV